MAEEPPPSEEALLQGRCRVKAREAFGTSTIFLRRSRKLTRRLRLLTYVGLLAPMAVGLVALALTATSKVLPVVISIASAIGGLQVVLFLWSVVAQWVEANAYALESGSHNSELAARYTELAGTEPQTLVEFKHKVALLDLEDNIRRQRDDQQGVTDAEMRRGMRAGLRQYQSPCATCKQVPTSMKATTCSVCGTFGIQSMIAQLTEWREERNRKRDACGIPDRG